jgi:alcohol dehydrogenase class IV
VDEALELYKSEGCNALIGFGGGSSMDCAKAVGARLAKPHQSLEEMKGILKVHRKLPLLIAIPTTAGTGSETTLAAVITDAETRHKYPINDFPLIPKYAILDPKVTTSLPPSITATTGMDALTHAVEAYIGKSTTYGTRKDAKMAVRLIFENLDTAYTDGGNLEARRNMLKASYYAGCAFTKSYVGYVHAVAHSLGGEYNVPHGLANAVLLPFVLEAYGNCIDEKLKQLAIEAGVADADTPEHEAAEAFIDAIKDMKKRLGIGDTIPEIREEDIQKLARYADKEANPLYPVPVLMDAKELEQFYYMLMA